MTWNGSMVGYLNGFLALGGGNLNTNVSKIPMPGVLPGLARGEDVEALIWLVYYGVCSALSATRNQSERQFFPRRSDDPASAGNCFTWGKFRHWSSKCTKVPRSDSNSATGNMWSGIDENHKCGFFNFQFDSVLIILNNHFSHLQSYNKLHYLFEV